MTPFYQKLADFQRKLIRGALRRNKGNLMHAARELGMHRNTLGNLCNRLGIDPTAFRPSGKSKRERQAESQKKYKERALANGLCAQCLKRPAGGKRGTKTACAICAETKRENEHKRAKRLRLYKVSSKQPLPPPDPRERPLGPRLDRMMAISARLSALQRQGAVAQRSL